MFRLCPTPTGQARHQWWYRDPKGNVQGPYPAQALIDWRVKGYFTDTIEVGPQQAGRAAEQRWRGGGHGTHRGSPCCC